MGELQQDELRGWERFVEVVRNLQPQQRPRRSTVVRVAGVVLVLLVAAVAFDEPPLIGAGQHVWYCWAQYNRDDSSSPKTGAQMQADLPPGVTVFKLDRVGSSAPIMGKPLMVERIRLAAAELANQKCSNVVWAQVGPDSFVRYVKPVSDKPSG